MDVPLSDQMLEAVIQRVRDAVEEMNDPERHEDAPRTVPRFSHDMLEFAIFKLVAQRDAADKVDSEKVVKAELKAKAAEQEMERLCDALTKLIPSLRIQLAIAVRRHAAQFPDTKEHMLLLADKLVPIEQIDLLARTPPRGWWKIWR